jgi:(R,R)-butanediol dehydrogenase/meso-butanediol dehydrogenase/diacetyl reductase
MDQQRNVGSGDRPQRRLLLINMNRLKAARYLGNKTFEVTEAPPQVPEAGEILLNVAYVGICGTDMHIYHGAMDQRVKPPQVIGHEMSGTVAALGEGVEGLQAGDRVVVRPLDNRGEVPEDRGFSHVCRNLKFMGIDSPGAFQSQWKVPAFTVHKLPRETSLKTAALIEPLAVACHDVKRGGVQRGDLVVVLGGGPIGILVALVARETGARVIVSEVNAERLHFARDLGLEAVNPLECDLEDLCRKESGGAGADVVFEVSGAKSAALQMTRLLAIRGRIVVVAIYPKPIELDLFQIFWKELTLIGARVYEPTDFEAAIRLVHAKSLPLEKMISQTIPLSAIQSAFESADQAPAGMKTLIDCQL